MKYWLVTAILLAGAQAAQAAEPSEQARQNYVCAGVAGVASQLLEKSDPAASGRLAQRARLLAESGVQFEVGRRIPQGDAVAAMATFLQSREAVYRADPGRVPADLADCRAKQMVPAGPTVTGAEVAAAMGSPPPPARPASPPAAAPEARPASAPPAQPAAAPDADLRRWLSGPWGKMPADGGAFMSEMIASTAFRRGGPEFTRRACPPEGLASPTDLLAHEFWFAEQPGGKFFLIRTTGDPGKTSQTPAELAFRTRQDADTFVYHYRNPYLRATEVITIRRLGADRLQMTQEIPGLTSPTNLWLGRCRRR